jgi:hypothetical protein
MDIDKQIEEALNGVTICPCCGHPMKGGKE